jgi:hypothetical protein
VKLQDSSATRAVLRQVLATLAYRATKVLRDVPAGFSEFTSGPSVRSPLRILEHLGDLMAWGLHMAQGEYLWRADGSGQWDVEMRRFFDSMAELDGFLASDAPLGHPVEMLIQGPLADALTHVGQLAMLRGAAGIPVRPESYARADITPGTRRS